MTQLEVAAGFVFEPFDGGPGVEQMIRQKLERHFLFEHPIVRQPNDAHSAVTQCALEIKALENPLAGAKNASFGFISVWRHQSFSKLATPQCRATSGSQ